MTAAVESGLLFAEPVELDHDGWVERARAAVAATSRHDVSDAFVASLTSRRLDLRSALGSFAVARHLPAHDFRGAANGMCSICGLHARTMPQDLNVLSFERFRWGGTRRLDVRYLAFDLEQLARAPRLAVTPADIETGRRLLATLRSAGPSATATAVATRLRDLKGNKHEREVVMGILGVAGVLASPAHPGFRRTFIAYADRALPPRHYIDMVYPTCWWRSTDGIDQDAVNEFLPRLT